MEKVKNCPESTEKYGDSQENLGILGKSLETCSFLEDFQGKLGSIQVFWGHPKWYTVFGASEIVGLRRGGDPNIRN